MKFFTNSKAGRIVSTTFTYSTPPRVPNVNNSSSDEWFEPWLLAGIRCAFDVIFAKRRWPIRDSFATMAATCVTIAINVLKRKLTESTFATSARPSSTIPNHSNIATNRTTRTISTAPAAVWSWATKRARSRTTCTVCRVTTRWEFPFAAPATSRLKNELWSRWARNGMSITL